MDIYNPDIQFNELVTVGENDTGEEKEKEKKQGCSNRFL